MRIIAHALLRESHFFPKGGCDAYIYVAACIDWIGGADTFFLGYTTWPRVVYQFQESGHKRPDEISSPYV